MKEGRRLESLHTGEGCSPSTSFKLVHNIIGGAQCEEKTQNKRGKKVRHDCQRIWRNYTSGLGEEEEEEEEGRKLTELYRDPGNREQYKEGRATTAGTYRKNDRQQNGHDSFPRISGRK